MAMMQPDFARQESALRAAAREARAHPAARAQSLQALVPEAPEQPLLRTADGANYFSCVAPQPLVQVMPSGASGMYREDTPCKGRFSSPLATPSARMRVRLGHA